MTARDARYLCNGRTVRREIGPSYRHWTRRPFDTLSALVGALGAGVVLGFMWVIAIQAHAQTCEVEALLK